MGLTEAETNDALREFMNTQDYKDKTNILTNPDLAEKRAGIESRLFANQLKRAPLYLSNALVETYQAVSPTAYAGDAIENLADIKEGNHYLERELEYAKDKEKMLKIYMICSYQVILKILLTLTQEKLKDLKDIHVKK